MAWPVFGASLILLTLLAATHAFFALAIENVAGFFLCDGVKCKLAHGWRVMLVAVTSIAANLAFLYKLTSVRVDEKVRAILVVIAASFLLVYGMFKTSYSIFRYCRSLRLHRAAWEIYIGSNFEMGARSAINGAWAGNWVKMSFVAAAMEVLVYIFYSTWDLNSQGFQTISPGDSVFMWTAFGWIGLMVAVAVLFQGLNPSRQLVKMCLEYLVPREYIAPSPASEKSAGITISRWRSADHQHGFAVAGLIIRSISGLRKKMDQGTYRAVDEICRSLAYAFRNRSFGIDPRETDQEYAEYCILAIGLAVNEDLLQACRNVESVVGRRGYCNEKGKPWVVRGLENFDGFLQANTRALIVLLAITVLAILLVSGQFIQALELLRQIVTSSK